MSNWPLLQRNKIEDSKINIAVQAVIDGVVLEDEVTAADTLIKAEEFPNPQDGKNEPPETTGQGENGTDVDHQPSIKVENAESVDVPAPGDSVNGTTSMVVGESGPDERGRTSERHESQAAKLRRLATKVFTLHSTWADTNVNHVAIGRMGDFGNRLSHPKTVECGRPYYLPNECLY